MNNAHNSELQQRTLTPGEIVNNFLFYSEPIDLKKTLDKMFFGCLTSENEILTDERHQLVHLYNTLNELFENVEMYYKSKH